MSNSPGFTQIPVGPVPMQVCPPMGKGVSVNVYNQDPLNVVTIGRTNTITQNGTNAIPVQPLTNAVLPGDSALYAVAPAGTASLIIIPEGGTVSPSPAQIAVQIAGSGLATQATLQAALNLLNAGITTPVPTLLNTFGPLTVGGPWGPLTVTVPTGGAYEIACTPVTAGGLFISDVLIQHLDAANNVVYIESFTASNMPPCNGAIAAGFAAGQGCLLRGNLQGSKLSISGVQATAAVMGNMCSAAPAATSAITIRVYAVAGALPSSLPKMAPYADIIGALGINETFSLPAAIGPATIGPLAPYAGPAVIDYASSAGGGAIILPFIACYTVANGGTPLYTIRFSQISGTNVGVVTPFNLDTTFHNLKVQNVAAVATIPLMNVVQGAYI